MNNPIIVAVTIAWLATCVGVSSACEAYVSCENVQEIHVSAGTRHLAEGKTEIFYGASVLVDATKCNLKEVHANCPHQTMVIRVGGAVFDLPKTTISTGGNWFGVKRSTPKKALDAAMGMCPDKVVVHFTEEELQGDTQQP